MSVSWVVLPIVPEIHDWLSENGFPVDIPQTRYPSLEELLAVLRSFDLPVQMEELPESTIGISAGEPHTSSYTYILGNNKEEGFAFQFYESTAGEMFMLEVLKRLCERFCKALVIYESSTATPWLVLPETDLDQAVVEWKRRIRENSIQ